MLKTKAAFILLITMMFCSNAFSQTVSLNDEWQFAVDKEGNYRIASVKEKAEWRPAQVPLSWQAQFPDLRDYQGVAWYKKTVELPQKLDSNVVEITFDAVDYLSDVYVNGRHVGSHEGGYTPFSFDISKLVKPGQNEIIVRVMDPVTTESGTEGISYWHIPHGKQSWYVQTSGIWQSARIDIKPKSNIRHVKITPNIDGRVELQVELSKDVEKQSQLHVSIFDPLGKKVASIKKSLEQIESGLTFTMTVKNPELWHLDSPSLYTVEASLANGFKIIERFGFRSFEARNGKFYFNGKPFYMIGALDQDFYPETIYTTPSEEYMRDQMLKAKKLGLNMLRCHIKVPDPLYLKVADEVGLLVWTEVPNWDVFTPEAAQRGEDVFNAMLERDWNHPSLVVLSIINESWGIDLQKEEQRNWLLAAFDRAKQKAVGRLVVDNSACWGNFHLKTDINDYHTYWAIPENHIRFDETVKDFGSRPDWLFSKFGDAQQTGQEPLVMSEFGNWGLPKLPEKLPWCFERDFDDRVVTLPAGVEERFKTYKYDEIFESYDELAEESQRAQLCALKYEIESLRKNPNIQGYIITEFTDINWEVNGLLDMWRNFKINAEILPEIQQQDILIPEPSSYTFSADDTVMIELYLSHFSQEELKNARVLWTATPEINGEFNIPKVQSAEITKIGSVTFKTPAIKVPSPLQMKFILKNASGNVAALNSCEVFLFPRKAKQSVALNVHDSDGKLAAIKDFIRNDNESKLESKVTITDVLDADILARLRAGESVIWLLNDSTKTPTDFPFPLISREQEPYDGNWASNLNWVRNNQAPFRNLNFNKSMGLESANIIPNVVITEIPAEHFSDVLAGMFVGWVHKNSGYVMQMQVGKGKLILCALQLAEYIDMEPVASAVLEELTKYAVSNECAPKLIWDVGD